MKFFAARSLSRGGGQLSRERDVMPHCGVIFNAGQKNEERITKFLRKETRGELDFGQYIIWMCREREVERGMRISALSTRDFLFSLSLSHSLSLVI